ncbi:uncharacterized protein BJ212DRAFT_1348063 [Suillus subaureus]|uniref:Uncharacterized protein n=1 Tax=Suillus subaureus TaxID=48587 RepID=A0A9P7ECK0_9AGAM|nr:uncharacterized protein BJ212DRAFT_1348063 [Suillus subaureus]KAG1817984.1 hypothetical protein BJ212DRAFT_1348063 [Suillus subaureus]
MGCVPTIFIRSFQYSLESWCRFTVRSFLSFLFVSLLCIFDSLSFDFILTNSRSMRLRNAILLHVYLSSLLACVSSSPVYFEYTSFYHIILCRLSSPQSANQ